MPIRAATPTDAAAIATVHVDSWRTTYAHLLPAAYLAALSYADRERLWRDILAQPTPPACVYVAEAADHHIVGFAAGGPARGEPLGYDAELYAIYLLAPDQRQGLGRDLLRAVVAHLRGRGAQALLVWVAADNPARAFYERLGGRHISAKQSRIGGVPLDEVAYGWGDLAQLASALTPSG